MTNGEKIVNTFHGKVIKNDGVVYFSTDGWTHAYADEWWNSEYKEPTTKNDLGVDCISRQAVIDELKRYFHDEYYQRTSIQDCRDCFIEDVLNNLPSVTPQEPILDKLREEVKSKIVKRPWLDFEDRERDRNDAFLEVLDVIDKYMAESEKA